MPAATGLPYTFMSETKITTLFGGYNAFFALSIDRLTKLLWHNLKIALLA